MPIEKQLEEVLVIDKNDNDEGEKKEGEVVNGEVKTTESSGKKKKKKKSKAPSQQQTNQQTNQQSNQQSNTIVQPTKPIKEQFPLGNFPIGEEVQYKAVDGYLFI